jgi:hypothetical protein
MQFCEKQPGSIFPNTSFFFVTYEWVQLTTVLHYTLLKRLASNKYSSLLSPVIGYKEYKSVVGMAPVKEKNLISKI